MTTVGALAALLVVLRFLGFRLIRPTGRWTERLIWLAVTVVLAELLFPGPVSALGSLAFLLVAMTAALWIILGAPRPHDGCCHGRHRCHRCAQ